MCVWKHQPDIIFIELHNTDYTFTREMQPPGKFSESAFNYIVPLNLHQHENSGAIAVFLTPFYFFFIASCASQQQNLNPAHT